MGDCAFQPKPNTMQNYLKSALPTIIALFFALSLQAQVAEVNYVKVKPGKWKQFMEMEKDSKKLHQGRVDRGVITGYTLYRNLFRGPDQDYDFIMVTSYDDYKKTENPWPQDLIDELFSKEAQEEFMSTWPTVVEFTGTEMYDRVTASELFHETNYILVGRMHVKPADWGKFKKHRTEIVKPMFDKVVEGKHHSGWSLWEKDGGTRDFKFVYVNGYTGYGDWKTADVPWQEIFDKVHPGKDFNQLRDEIMSYPKTISTELWKVEIRVEAQED